MTGEVKIRTLAAADATLQPYFGTGPFRWFDRQIPPEYIDKGACVRLLRVSTIRSHTMQGITHLSAPRFQIDVLSIDPETARAAASAIIAWLQTISLAQNNQFASPVTSPPQHPNLVLNQRAGMEPRISGKPVVYVETLDVRVYNLES